MPAGYDQLMIPVIKNIPVFIAVLVLTVPVAILAMRLAERNTLPSVRNSARTMPLRKVLQREHLLPGETHRS